jgi:hypothetical protein
MARRRRGKRRERRQRSSRLLSRLGIGLALAVPLLYFAFTKLFFDPFEGSQPPFQTLIPRDVDLFLHRERLDTDVDSFPWPNLMTRIERTREYKALAGTEWFAGLGWPAALKAALEEAAAGVADVPFDPMADLLGREVAVIARDGGGGELAPVLLARISDRTKLFVEALDSDVAVQKSLPGATVGRVEDEDVPGLSWRRLDSPELGTWFFARDLDLLVAGQDELLVRDVLRTVQVSQESSLGLSRLYLQELPPARGLPGQRFSLEVFLNGPEMLGLDETAPDPAETPSPDALAELLGKLFDPALLMEMIGRLELDDAVALRLHAEVDNAAAVASAQGLIGTPSFVLVGSLHTDLVGLINSTLKDLTRYSPGWQVDEVSELVDYVDRMLGGEITVALRPFDHQIPEGSQPLPLIVFMARLKDPARWRALDEVIVRGHQALGLDRERMWQQDEGVGLRKWLGLPLGLPIEEISYIVLDGTTAAIATDDGLLREVVACYAGNRSTLNARRTARDIAGRFGDARGNLALWMASEPLLRVLDPYADYLAERETIVDLGALRLQKRKELLAQRYSTWVGREDELPEELAAEIDEQLNEIIGALERERRQVTVPALAATRRERLQWLTLIEAAGLALRLGENDADLALQATTVLGTPGP